MMSVKPNQHVSPTRHCIRDSFGGIYSDKENDIFLQLARSVFEDEDDDSVGTSVWENADNQEWESSGNVEERGFQCQSSLKPTRNVTFGCVSVYEFKPDQAPTMASVFEYREELLRPTSTMQRNTKKTKKTTPKQQERRIQISKQQFSLLKLPKRASQTSRDSSLDREPRLPKRSFDETKPAQRARILYL